MSVKNRIPERDGKTGLKPPVKSYIVKPTRIPKTLISITNNKEYAKVMAQIDELIKTPDSELTKSQANELHKLALAAQRYEKSLYNIKPPSTFEGILEMKMYELKLNQGEMAKMLQVSDAKFSLILNGRQKPDINMLKTMNQNLGIDGNYLLSVV